jgi:molecular chaperone DnaK (HSP70)
MTAMYPTSTDVIAIDFGTSNTVVSLLEPDTQTPKTIRFPGISRLFKLRTAQGEAQEIPVVPTLLLVKGPDQFLIGEQVRSRPTATGTSQLGLSQPDRLFKSFKRDLVADFQPPSRQIDGCSYSVETIAKQFLQQIWQQLQQQQIHPAQVIFTVPVGAFERYLSWFQEIATDLAIAKIQLVDESTAAALGYAVQHPGALVLVVDFGGGTLDLSLVRTTAVSAVAVSTAAGGDRIHQAEVLAKADADVGGTDIDLWIVEDYLHQMGLSRSTVGEVGWQNLLAIAERLKVRLSSVEVAKESWLDEASFTAHELRLDRSHFEEILEARQFLEHLRQALDEVLAIALGKGISKVAIEQVLLVGGSCLIPAVQQLVLSYFGRHRVKMHKPFEAVAHGALVLNQLARIDDYLHHSYAIRIWEPQTQTYAYFPLFARGTRYPCQRREPLTLQVATEGQRDIRLDIGEVAAVAEAEVTYDAQGRMTSTPLRHQETYRSLENNHEPVCVAHLTAPGKLGVDRICVHFAVTERRVLVATVRDLLTDAVLVDREAIAQLQ